MIRAHALGLHKFEYVEKEGDLHAIALVEFVDPIHAPGDVHGVCVFALKKGDSPSNYEDDLIGPLGPSSRTHSGLIGKHAYGRDTWGIVEDYQLEANPQLKELLDTLPEGTVLLLAGVRLPLETVWGPASNFILVRRKL
jgi:phage tail protein X